MGSLEFVDIDRLIPHEEVIRGLLESVISELRSTGLLLHPVIVSREHGIVLDGNHRVEALRRMGARRVLAYSVDYMSNEVEVKRWFRTVRRDFDLSDFLSRISRDLEAEVAPVDPERAMDGMALDGRAFASVMDSTGSAYLLRSGSPVSTYQAYRMMAFIDRLLEPYGLVHQREEEALDGLRRGEWRAVVASRPIGKQDVICSALEGLRFPPKSSRHVVKGRVLFAMVPLKVLLSEDDSTAEAFLERLKGLRTVKLPAGSTVDRFYEEEVVVMVHGMELRHLYPPHIRNLLG
ncbi:MAG: hypothetical protein NYU90_01235 [Aigarchaeota archaeon]|nr:hypothetical protein [Candidatus Calditenuis fumarioli]